ncbi:AraC family transcriptional regulator [Rhizobium sp. LjRoot98]|uniref:AraC family ligand binding domain-containing protein n=1 Tax=Rhizobium sp. LjRoot98 TaxID=3342345 RepID=UPI003ED14541
MGNSMLKRLIENGPVMRTVSLPRGRHSLHTMPTSTGYEIRTDETYDWDGRKRGQTPFTVQHTIAGAGNLRYENRTYRVREGETLLVLVPHNHRYWLERNGRWEFFWISMNGEEALRIHKAILATTGPILNLKPETIERLADCSLRLISGGAEAPGNASAIAYESAMVLYDDVFGSHPVIGQEYRTMQHVIDHIMANLERPLPVETLAEVSGLSRAHFSRVFAASEGMPPAEFVLRKRLRRATKLLTNAAHLSVKEVAIMAGFEDPNYFAKVFRRYFGASPTEFRTTGMYSSIAANGRGAVAAQ